MNAYIANDKWYMAACKPKYTRLPAQPAQQEVTSAPLSTQSEAARVIATLRMWNHTGDPVAEIVKLCNIAAAVERGRAHAEQVEKQRKAGSLKTSMQIKALEDEIKSLKKQLKARAPQPALVS